MDELEVEIDQWDERFIMMARQVAGWSKDPSTKVGAVIVRPDRTIASVGFNGFPRGVDDSEELLNDRDERLLRMVHAEMNAILAAREPLKGYTLYVTPFASCSHCAAAIIQAGIGTVVVDLMKQPKESWARSIEVGHEMFDTAGVDVIYA